MRRVTALVLFLSLAVPQATRAATFNVWFVVTAVCGGRESSPGTDSLGRERPAADPGCP